MKFRHPQIRSLSRRTFLCAAGTASLQSALPLTSDGGHLTVVAIEGESFYIDGRATYEGRRYRGLKVEGLLMNSRMANGVFDDLNPATRSLWKYPDTGKWDPDRNTREFVAAMPAWRKNGLLSFTLNLQGGNPQGYVHDQPWYNTAFREDGAPRQEYFRRLRAILDAADRLGMAPMVGCFYFGQDQWLRNEVAVIRALDETVHWILARGYRNVLLEVDNECNGRYRHEILGSTRVHELMQRVKQSPLRGERLMVGTSFGGGAIPTDNVVAASDFILLHGNRVRDPAEIASMVRRVRQLASYGAKPVLFNEDDHYDFERRENNMLAAVGSYASWGLLDIGQNNYQDGYQSPPIKWEINTSRKREFFGLLKEMTGS